MLVKNDRFTYTNKVHLYFSWLNHTSENSMLSALLDVLLQKHVSDDKICEIPYRLERATSASENAGP